MNDSQASPLSRDIMLEYFIEGAVPRRHWRIGMELEKMGRDSAGQPIPYDGPGPSVRKVVEFIRERRGGDPLFEGSNVIGLDAPWGSITLEPGGQVEWSSRPAANLSELERSLLDHLAVMRDASDALGVRWLDQALEPDLPIAAMDWMPKQRYRLMREYLGQRGRLAHRMMTQTASIQCAYDYEGPEDWSRKFKAAAAMTPVATALFANSSRMDGADTGFVNFREAIWRETDPARCGLPPIVFGEGFGLEAWIDWILDVPGELLDGASQRPLRLADWLTHVSQVFTEVRSYTYIEVRSADLQPDERAFEVPAFWTGLLYCENALEAALELGAGLDYETWDAAMRSASREGLDGKYGRRGIREVAGEAIATALSGLRGGARCVGDPAVAVGYLEALADRSEL